VIQKSYPAPIIDQDIVRQVDATHVKVHFTHPCNIIEITPSKKHRERKTEEPRAKSDQRRGRRQRKRKKAGEE
jgi:hypothetical protein